MPKLINRAAVAVGAAEILVLAANPRRRWAVIQQTSANPVRVGAQGVTAATGISLAQRDRLVLEGEEGECPTDAIYAIREAAADGTIVVLEYADA